MTTRSITEGQEKQFFRTFIEDVVDQARKQVPLNKGSIQTLLGNSGKVQTGIVELLVKYSATDDRFGLQTWFEITVPKGYNHDTQLATFASYAEKEKFDFYNEAITDKNFNKATQRLIPGKTYLVKIFGIKQRVPSDDCLAFLTAQRAILVGAQGLSLVRQLKKDRFPVDKCTVSFDKKNTLWRDAAGHHRVPFSGWNFDLGYFQGDWNSDYCLLCVCELKI
jgi:hypothetical protein